MKARLQTYWEDLRSSYWFIPSVMAVGAILLSLTATALDRNLGTDWIDGVGWLYANKPDGARALLSTIAGSMITVAGVTFSITIASVAYATSQFGPRLLTNFMRDTGNQVTLGTFIATFLYCLLVLRTIRSADEPIGSLEEADLMPGFVPHIALLCGLAFALMSVGVLIYFIHHVPESIHASNVIAGVGRDLNHKIASLFPEQLGHAAPALAENDARRDLPERFFAEATSIPADGNGYVQYIDEDGLLHAARDHDLLLRLACRPGDFVREGETVLFAWPAARVDDDLRHRLRGTFAWGRQRTQAQDVLFLTNELVEIATRALSPGVNDPFTAITCMDWLSSALTNLAQRRLPAPYRYDEDGALRVTAHPVTFEDFAEAIFGQLRPYVQADRNAALHLMKVFAEVAGAVPHEAYRAVLLRYASALKRGCAETLDAQTVDAVEDRYRVLVRVLSDPTLYQAHAEDLFRPGNTG